MITTNENEMAVKAILNTIFRVNTKVTTDPRLNAFSHKDGIREYNLLTKQIIINTVKNRLGGE
jgi:hypothetical protein